MVFAVHVNRTVLIASDAQNSARIYSLTRGVGRMNRIAEQRDSHGLSANLPLQRSRDTCDVELR
ncbi:unannotated protein [freshwater metagenome]|uniref:Unannotated protein n=1 Tax=freshwater metagenome TaxID=449393 RepID=A0A6J6IDT9_9ZZZZ